MEYRNYIFDLYGTLIDIHTDEMAAKTWKKWCKKLDARALKHPPYYRLRADFWSLDNRYRAAARAKGECQVPEIDVIEVYRELFEQYGNGVLSEDILYEISYEFRVASRDYIKLFPGVTEYLKQLSAQGKHCYILSNAQRSYTWPEIEMFGLNTLTEAQLISSDEKCMKPDKQFFEVLINKYKLNREECIMHGDSLYSDIDGAKAAGIAAVHLAGENSADKYYLNAIKM